MELRTIGALAGALVLSLALGCGYSPPKEEEWERVKVGATQQEVVDELGEPYMAQGSQVGGVNEDLYLYSDTTKYKEGDRYQYYMVRFENGRVVEKHRYLTKRSPNEVLAEINRLRGLERRRQKERMQEPPPSIGRTEPPAGEEQPAGVGKPEKQQEEVAPEPPPLPDDLDEE